MPDRIHETLSTLRTDTERTRLADASAVRHRGNQRTRRQAVATSLAVVVLVAGVIGIAGGLTGDRRASDLPADPPSATTSVTDERVLALSADPFLQDGDLTGIGPYGDFRDSGDAPTTQLLQCIDATASGGSGERRSTVLFEPDIGEPTVHEHVLRFDGTAPAAMLAARAFVARLTGEFGTCDPGDPAEVTVDDRSEEANAVGGFRAARLSTPTADAGIGYYELGVASRANVVVVVEWSSMGNPEGDHGWVWTTERMQTALDRAVG
ncbi:MAG: hypothetical protein ACRDV1_12490 [Actinomycetes bacterium]